MATRSLEIMGMRLSLFGDHRRIGLEMSSRLPLRRTETGATPQAPAPVPGTRRDPDVEAINWYHTLDLGDGVVTPGFYDHRPILNHYALPERLDGLRVLDIAAFDGFWSFEFERRGAAEVVALDIEQARELDLAPNIRAGMTEAELNRRFGAGFALAHARKCSKIRHVHCNVYDVSPERLGLFDLVHCGDLLLHLRDPALALARIRSVTRGEALISEAIFPDLDRHDAPLMVYDGGVSENIWWRFGSQALTGMIRDAGFGTVEERARFRYGPRGAPASMWHSVIRAANPIRVTDHAPA
jgi:tRNA (mo5U34)-methyltransferase